MSIKMENFTYEFRFQNELLTNRDFIDGVILMHKMGKMEMEKYNKRCC